MLIYAVMTSRLQPPTIAVPRNTCVFTHAEYSLQKLNKSWQFYYQKTSHKAYQTKINN